MKKIILFFIVSLLVLPGCNKTDVDVDLEKARQNEELISDEEFEKLKKEDPDFAEDYYEELMDAHDDQISREKSELIEELEDLEDKKRSGKGFSYSCNLIADGSTCIEYYGSFWTYKQISLGCPDGIVSKNPCPNDTVGGCNTGEGTFSDMISWLYLRGDGGMDAESVKYAKMACDATMLSSWITRY